MNKYKKENGKYSHNFKVVMKEVMNEKNLGYIPDLFIAQWPADCFKKYFPDSKEGSYHITNLNHLLELEAKGLLKSDDQQKEEKGAFILWAKQKL